jgi:hypothetical protein
MRSRERMLGLISPVSTQQTRRTPWPCPDQGYSAVHWLLGPVAQCHIKRKWGPGQRLGGGQGRDWEVRHDTWATDSTVQTLADLEGTLPATGIATAMPSDHHVVHRRHGNFFLLCQDRKVRSFTLFFLILLSPFISTSRLYRKQRTPPTDLHLDDP